MLGFKAKDKITGLEGVITAKAEFQYAPCRWELTPSKLTKDGMLLRSVWLDEPRIQASGKKAVIDVNLVTPTVQLGQEIEDSITGKYGVATGRYTFVNGCIRVELTPKHPKKDPEAEGDGAVVYDEQRLLVLDTSTDPITKTKVEVKHEVPGGPRRGPTPYSRPTR